MSLSDSLDTLEDKIHFLAVRLTQISEENLQWKERLNKEKEKNKSLMIQIDNLKKESDKYEVTKKNIKQKIEALIEQLSSNYEFDESDDPEDFPHHITLEETEALNEPLSEHLLADTAINFFPDEET